MSHVGSFVNLTHAYRQTTRLPAGPLLPACEEPLNLSQTSETCQYA